MFAHANGAVRINAAIVPSTALRTFIFDTPFCLSEATPEKSMRLGAVRRPINDTSRLRFTQGCNVPYWVSPDAWFHLERIDESTVALSLIYQSSV
jgi:hypothetical protein